MKPLEIIPHRTARGCIFYSLNNKIYSNIFNSINSYYLKFNNDLTQAPIYIINNNLNSAQNSIEHIILKGSKL